MICYITNDSGTVVAQFDGVDPEVKDGHTLHEVETDDDLPGVDTWDPDYER